jgi:hypothetical protein
MDMLDALAHRLGTLQTLATHISWSDQEKLGRELGEERKRGLSWETSSIDMHYA